MTDVGQETTSVTNQKKPQKSDGSDGSTVQSSSQSKRKWDLWTDSNNTVFFECVLQFGKDFDAMEAKMKSKAQQTGQAKFNKTKDQCRQYFYTRMKKLKMIIADTGSSAAEEEKLKQELDSWDVSDELRVMCSYWELRKKLIKLKAGGSKAPAKKTSEKSIANNVSTEDKKILPDEKISKNFPLYLRELLRNDEVTCKMANRKVVVKSKTYERQPIPTTKGFPKSGTNNEKSPGKTKDSINRSLLPRGQRISIRSTPPITPQQAENTWRKTLRQDDVVEIVASDQQAELLLKTFDIFLKTKQMPPVLHQKIKQVHDFFCLNERGSTAGPDVEMTDTETHTSVNTSTTNDDDDNGVSTETSNDNTTTNNNTNNDDNTNKTKNIINNNASNTVDNNINNDEYTSNNDDDNDDDNNNNNDDDDTTINNDDDDNNNTTTTTNNNNNTTTKTKTTAATTTTSSSSREVTTPVLSNTKASLMITSISPSPAGVNKETSGTPSHEQSKKKPKFSLFLYPKCTRVKNLFASENTRSELVLTVDGGKELPSLLKFLRKRWAFIPTSASEPIRLFPMSPDHPRRRRGWGVEDCHETVASLFKDLNSPSDFKMDFSWFDDAEAVVTDATHDEASLQFDEATQQSLHFESTPLRDIHATITVAPRSQQQILNTPRSQQQILNTAATNNDGGVAQRVPSQPQQQQQLRQQQPPHQQPPPPHRHQQQPQHVPLQQQQHQQHQHQQQRQHQVTLQQQQLRQVPLHQPLPSLPSSTSSTLNLAQFNLLPTPQTPYQQQQHHHHHSHQQQHQPLSFPDVLQSDSVDIPPVPLPRSWYATPPSVITKPLPSPLDNAISFATSNSTAFSPSEFGLESQTPTTFQEDSIMTELDKITYNSFNPSDFHSTAADHINCASISSSSSSSKRKATTSTDLTSSSPSKMSRVWDSDADREISLGASLSLALSA